MLIVLREINSARHQHDTERTQKQGGIVGETAAYGFLPALF